MYTRTQRAFTLVELLVVIAIIGILIALLLPAVQAAREAARRITCTNQLKQLGLAMHNYHSANGRFSAGMVTMGTGCPPTGGVSRSRCPWSVALLPYLEQTDAYNRFDMSAMFSSLYREKGPNTKEQFRVNPFFHCPSDPLAAAGSPNTNYFACMGGGVLGEEDCHATGWDGYVFFSNGIYFKNSTIGVKDITDGTSSTIMIGEGIDMDTPAEETKLDKHASWASGLRTDGYANYYTITATVVQHNLPVEQGGYWTVRFNSYHPGGAHVLMADSSAHFLSEDIDVHVYRRLGNREDGEPLIGWQD